MKITKAVIAVAGYGTRFIPATKSMPKEMIPLVDKPIVQYLVEEAVESGIEDIILVTRAGSGGIADHFDSTRELEVHLETQGNQKYLDIIQAIPKLANFAFVRQARHLPYGNGTPLLAARRFLTGGEPFVYMFGDDLVLGDKPCVKQLIDTYVKHEPGAVVAVQEVPQEVTNRYGIVKLKEGVSPPEMESIIEKPDPDEAPSNLAQFGRFVLSPRVVEILETTALGKGNELYLTDAIDTLSKENRVLVESVEGQWLTTGDPLNFLKATVQYALKHPEYGAGFSEYLKELKL